MILEALTTGTNDAVLAIAAAFFADVSSNPLAKAWLGDQFIEPLFATLAQRYSDRSLDSALFNSVAEIFRNCCANHEPNQQMLASLIKKRLEQDGKLTPFTSRITSFALTLSDTMNVCLINSRQNANVRLVLLFLLT